MTKTHKCYECGGDMAPAVMLKGHMLTGECHRVSPPLTRKIDMAGCPVLACKCGNYLWREEADEWYVATYARTFADIPKKRKKANDQ